MPDDLTVSLRIRALVGEASRRLRGLRRDVRGVGGEAGRASAQTRRYGRAWDSAGASFGRARRSLVGLRGLLTGFGVVLALRAVAGATERQQQAVAQLERGLRNLRGETPLTSAGLQAVAKHLQDVTTFGDEATIKVQSLLLTFRQIDPSVFNRVTEAALDMAVALDQAPRDAAIQLAKALEDPVQGLTALRRSGTVFSAEQTKVIRKLAETNRLAEAQALILAEVERQYAGSARAARETLPGALDALGNAFGDLLEGSNGGTEDLRREIENLVTLLQDPATKDAAAGFGRAIAGGLKLAIDAVQLLGGGINKLLGESRQSEIRDLLATRTLGPRDVGRLRFANRGEAADPIAEFFTNPDIDTRLGEILAAARAAGRKLPDELVKGIRESGADVPAALLDAVTPARPAAATAGTRQRPTAAGAGDARARDAALKQLVALQKAAEDQIARLTLDRIALVDRAEKQALAEANRLAVAAINAAGDDAKEIARINTQAAAAEHDIRARAAAQRKAIREAEARDVADKARQTAEQVQAAADRQVEARQRVREAVERQEGRLGIVDRYSAAIREAEAWRDDQLAILAEAGAGYEALRDRVIAAYEAMAEAAERAAARQRGGWEGARAGIGAALDDIAMRSRGSFAQAREATERAFGSMEDALVDFVRTGRLNFSRFVDGIIADLARIAVRQAIIGPLAQGLLGLFGGGGLSGGLGAGAGGALGSPFGIPLKHGGGRAGDLSGVRRRGVPAAAFAFARRYHGGAPFGLSANEVPTILDRRERVFTPEQVKAAFQPALNVEIQVENRGAPQSYRTERAFTADDGRRIVQVVAEDMAAGGDTARATGGHFGLSAPART